MIIVLCHSNNNTNFLTIVFLSFKNCSSLPRSHAILKSSPVFISILLYFSTFPPPPLSLLHTPKIRRGCSTKNIQHPNSSRFVCAGVSSCSLFVCVSLSHWRTLIFVLCRSTWSHARQMKSLSFCCIYWKPYNPNKFFVLQRHCNQLTGNVCLWL